MRRSTALFIQVTLVFGIISMYECHILQQRQFSRDKDAIWFEDDDYSTQINRYEHHENPARKIVIDNRHIIDPPPRPTCKPCYKPDAHGRCRRILGSSNYCNIKDNVDQSISNNL